jgi:hypothetical protein
MVRRVSRSGVAGVEIVAMDAGPGMDDLAASTRDGYSTSGSLGIGLGSIARQATELEVYSAAGKGTVIAATMWPAAAPPQEPGALRIGAVSRPMSGEEVTGDGYATRCLGREVQVMLCDGLGHGPLAAAATQAATAAFLAGPTDGPKAVVEHLHRSLRHTRGVVVLVVQLDPDREIARFAGLGNVSGTVFSGAARRGMTSQPGIAGHQSPQVRELESVFPSGSILVMHSDGLTARWNLHDYPGLAGRAPLLIAATLMRDAGVRRDDAAVLVAKAHS